MSFASYSLTPASNTTIAGQSIAEGTTAPGTINLAIRQIMADGKALYDQVNAISLTGFASLTAPAFIGQPTVSTRGAILHHNNSGNASGRIFVQSAASAAPTMSNGDILLTY